MEPMSSENGAASPSQIVVPHKKHGSAVRSAKRTFKRFTQKVLGWVLMAIGFVLIAAGFVLIIVPGHYFLVVAGLILVLRNAFWARRQFIHLKRRHPNWVMPIRKLLRRNPPIVSIFWQQILKFERVILRKSHQLGAFRRRLRRRTAKA